MFTITDKEFKQLSCYIKTNFGINLKEKKKTLMVGRLNNVLLEMGFKNFSEYYDCIIADKTGDAAVTLIDKITTNHTFFMREADHFHYFRDKVLTYLKETVKDKDLRIWSAGCSSGEEPYTLAMIIDEFFGEEKKKWDRKILATDISNRAINKALEGIYSKKEIESLPVQWKLKYFRQLDKERFVIVDTIKNEVIFIKFNLMNAFPFKKKFHVIFCRNVMIYFDNNTKYQLVNKLYDSLDDGGYLFVGHSESLDSTKTRFKHIAPAIYRKSFEDVVTA